MAKKLYHFYLPNCRQKIGKMSPENFLATFGKWPKNIRNVRKKGDELDLLPNVARKLANCRQKIFWRHLANSQKIIPLDLANGQKIIPLFGKWPKNYTTFICQIVARKLANCRQKIFWRHLAICQKKSKM
jgi:hypothetical protein